jgi:hypothetical protein
MVDPTDGSRVNGKIKRIGSRRNAKLLQALVLPDHLILL